MTDAEKIKAIETIYKDEFDSLLRRANAILKDIVDAENVVQDTFVRAIQNVDKYKVDKSLGAWINKIFVRLVVNAVKKRNKRNDTASIDDCHNLIDDIRQKEYELYKSTWNKLTPTQQRVLMLRRDGFKYREISILLNMPIGSISTHIIRARHTINASVLKLNDVDKLLYIKDVFL